MLDSTGNPIYTTKDAINACNNFWLSRLVFVIISAIVLFYFIHRHANLESFWSMTFAGLGFNYETVIVSIPYLFMALISLILSWSFVLTVDLRRVINLITFHKKIVSFSILCVYVILIFGVVSSVIGMVYISLEPIADYISLGFMGLVWYIAIIVPITEMIYKALLLISDKPSDIKKNHKILW